ncbi:MAG: universal stress protein [Dehalococcoidia bacterium]|nr:universal stress protein [Dehalococcoidia bacterium]
MFKILVATDGSDYAHKAADYAGLLARKIDDAEITVLSVLDPGLATQASVSPAGMPVTIPINLLADVERALNTVLQDTQQKLLSTGKKVTTRLEHGQPAKVICDIADKESFDLIVMGSSGQGRIADILLGSVSDRVVHKARVPVLIVRTKEEHH